MCIKRSEFSMVKSYRHWVFATFFINDTNVETSSLANSSDHLLSLLVHLPLFHQLLIGLNALSVLISVRVNVNVSINVYISVTMKIVYIEITVVVVWVGVIANHVVVQLVTIIIAIIIVIIISVIIIIVWYSYS